MTMFSFQSVIIKTDVTAVKILKKYYLVGVGGYVHVFDKKFCKLCKKINVFEGQKIYGFVPNAEESKILVYGGRYIKIISIINSFGCTYVRRNESVGVQTPDWILAVKWLNDYDNVVSVSMHNKVQIWNNNLELLTEVICEEKCILYSAFICNEKFDDLVILSGTVFSEVLIWRPIKGKDSPVLKRLQKHKGVIFSVHCNENLGYISSSSDDRSTVVWKPNGKNLLAELNNDDPEITVACHVFGHLSRVFRCLTLEKYFITVGEDSFVNIWSFGGTLIRKIETHQGGPIWSVDANENDNIVLTGGSDCGATVFPVNSKCKQQELSIPNKEVPKTVGCLNDNNLVVICESGTLYYHQGKTRKWSLIQKHTDVKSYAILEVSKCKNLFALAGFQGQIYIYKQENHTLCCVSSSQTKSKSRIFAVHWLNCHTFLICEADGIMTLYFSKIDNIVPESQYVLPPSKERWSTAAVSMGKNFVVGDRRGNLHLFEFGKREVIQTLKKVHSHLGVTNLILEDDKLISLGRNSLMKIFTLNEGALQLVSSNKLPFTWLLNITENLLLAFSGDKFILWQRKTKRIIFEKSCGGGHRSWDFLKTGSDVLFCYIKDKIVHVYTLNLNDFTPIDLIEGYQVKEINSVKCIEVPNKYIIISGGEDTTLRINITDGVDFHSIVSLKSHLSSIRAITVYKLNVGHEETNGTYLVFSGGGRAQIICWKLEITLNDCDVTNVVCTEQHSYYRIPDCEESEMRIMDLCVVHVNDNLYLLAGCSDGNIKIFVISYVLRQYHLKFYKDVKYELKCILKLCSFTICTSKILVTMATDGQLVFWNTFDVCSNKREVQYFHSIKCHQSGINSYDFIVINDSDCLFVTGGDDNAIALNLIRIQNINTPIQNVDSFSDVGTHCAQITGVFLCNDYFITSSIDQRVAIFKWEVICDKIVCKYVTKYNTAVADLQGLCCFENNDFDLFIYGKGIEYIKIKNKA